MRKLSHTLMGATAFCSISVVSAGTSWWAYDVERDAMTGKEEITAHIQSKSTAELKWPHGSVRGRIIVRKHPRHGRDIIFAASGGQIPCRSYSPCSVLVRFDDNQPIKIQAANPSDGSPDVIFLRGFDRLLAAISKSKTMRIEIEFYSNGLQQFTFDVSGLKTELFSNNQKIK